MTLRTWMILSWVALPSVMFGGFSLLRLLNRGDVLSPYQVRCFRAGHAHAGVLTVLSLVYQMSIATTRLSAAATNAACAILFVGILAQAGGFFLHMFVGREGQPSAGTRLTMLGAVLLALAVAILVYGMVWLPAPA